MSINFQGSLNRYRIRFINADTKFALRKYGGNVLIRIVSYIIYLLKPIIPKSFIRLNRPIFIIGCSRSGSTLFVDMFAQHEQLANWTEAGQIFDLAYFDSDIDHVKDEQHVTPFNSWRINVFFGLYTYIKGKKRFVNKNLENSLRIRFLKKIFPDSLFIHLIRDGRAVVRSSYAQTMEDSYRQKYGFGFFPKPPLWREYRNLSLVLRFSHQWVDVIKYIRETASAVLSENNYREILYEDFCRDPYNVLRSTDIFCGLDYEKRLYNKIPVRFSSQNFKWHSYFDSKQIAQIEKIIGDLLLDIGYSDS